MHDDRLLTEQRLDRVLRERIRPAVYGAAVPLAGSRLARARRAGAAGRGAGGRVPAVRGGHGLGPAVGHHLVLLPRAGARRVGRPGGRGGHRPRLRQRRARVRRGGPGLPAGRVPGAWACTAAELGAARASWRPSDGAVRFFVEAAANPTIARPVTPLGDTLTAGDEPLYRLRRADLAVFDAEVWDLVHDLEVLSQLMHELPVDGPRRWEILRALERALDALTWTTCRAPPRPPAASSPRRWPRPPTPPRTWSRRSGTRTSTRPGCGRCARRSARWPGPRPTSPR